MAASKSKPASKPAPKSKIDLAMSGVRHFVFHACLVEQSGKTLTLTVPGAELMWRGAKVDKKGHAAWTRPAPLSTKEIDIACAGRVQARKDGAAYPKAARVDGPKIVFTGATSFGRVLTGESSKLVVQADVTGITGLPKGTSWSGFESIELTGSALVPHEQPVPRTGKALELADGGTGSGPHQPYP